ncbi:MULTISPECIES: prolipoprotein diacylglyceryl transferase [unclassified Mycobacterium]|uniref:prolipoprotein diacylglyceryl transferase n=1 Tax=unclassified Mycobacterium TaxID=2642494 RepID=UPI0029C6B7E7|nr:MULTISPECIES: prolipoprotein diacylglyceryl transferase [unclassified Mycobacterium]
MTATILASFPSPSQGVWHLGPLPIRAYALCIIAGIVAALLIGDRRWVARGGDRGLIYDVALWAVPFGLIGGRLYHVMTDWKTYFGHDGLGFVAALKIWDGGLGIWGAVALGGVGAWIACRHHGVPLPAFGDAIAPGIILAQAIGRLGNYFNQELYGRETTLPWGLEIFERRNASGQTDMLNGVSTGVPLYDHPVHPTFLYELLWNLLIFGLLIWADRRFKLGHGRLFALYVAGYCVGRFWVELMRNDYATLIAGIRVNTFTSTFVFLGAVIYIMVAPKGREDPKTLRSKVYAQSEDAELDSWVDDLSAVEATSGVVAAAKVAGAKDAAESAKPDDEPKPDKQSEAAAEGEELAEDVETASSEDIAEAEKFAAAGADAAQDTDGVGAVEGDEVSEAVAEAPEVHEAAVEASADAEVAAEEVAEPAPETASEPASEPADEPEVAAEEVAEAEPEAEPESEAEPADDAEGLGAVDGDEVSEAVAEAPEVHEAAVEAADDAEVAAEEVAEPAPETASEPASEPEAEPADEPEADAEEVAEAEPEAEPEFEAEPADDAEGLGAVDGDEVSEAVAEAPEVHEAAVEAADDAEEAAEEVAEPAPETASEPEQTSPASDSAEESSASDSDAVEEPVAERSRRRWWRRG